MAEQSCPRCKSTKYRNPSLKFMVNTCGHTLCENCVEALFIKGSGNCPQCNNVLRRTNFRVQVFEDPTVEKEVDIRKRILRDYNKKEEDFDTLREYNDYLEEIETLVLNLMYDIDVAETKNRIETYRQENREQIARSRARLCRADREIEEILERERIHDESRKQELLEHELQQRKKKLRDQEALIDALAYSSKDPTNIVDEFSKKVAKQREEEKQLPPPKAATEFSTGIKIGTNVEQSFLPLPKEEGEPFIYEPYEPAYEGPTLPIGNADELRKFSQHVRAETESEAAGGFSREYPLYHALQDAFQGIYYMPGVAR